MKKIAIMMLIGMLISPQVLAQEEASKDNEVIQLAANGTGSSSGGSFALSAAQAESGRMIVVGVILATSLAVASGFTSTSNH